MEYKYLTQDEQNDRIAQALIAREREHFDYELNRLNYVEILASADVVKLPAEWPDNIAKFKGVGGEQLAAALTGDDYDLAVQLQFRDRVAHLLKTTLAEQTKTASVYAALDKQLPDGADREAAVQRVQDAEVAQKQARLAKGGG